MGWFRKMGRSCKKGSWGLGLHRSEQLDVEAGIGGCATPYRTALYRTWGQGNQPSGPSTGPAKDPPGGRWDSHVFGLLAGGFVMPAIESGESRTS